MSEHLRSILYRGKIHQLTISDLVRFNEKLYIDDNGCWIWRSMKLDAYPTFTLFGEKMRGNRASYLIFNSSPILIDKPCICHSCDVPRCVCPDHLFSGTHKENMADMVSKGRSAMGEASGRSVLTEADIIKIRMLNDSGNNSMEIHKRFPQVCSNTIKSVINNETWIHLPFCEKAPVTVPRMTVLNTDAVIEIRMLYDSGVRPIEIFSRFPEFNKNTIKNAIYGPRWKNVAPCANAPIPKCKTVLNESDVINIRRLRDSGIPTTEINSQFPQAHAATIRDVLINKSWKRVGH